MKALLIVDVQNDFLPGGALAVPHGDAIIEVINRLQPLFPHVVATKDWHPEHHVSFASSHHKKPGELVEVKGMRQELWPDHCIQNTFGSELSSHLNQEKIEKVFFKGADPQIDSYSAFFDNAHMRSTGLGEYLQSIGVDEIFVVGLATDYCVKYSVLDAAKFDLKITVLLEGCRGIEMREGDIARAIQEMEAVGAHIS